MTLHNPPTRAILVVGMHRSGTSLVARMLEAGGVHFGTPENLAGPARDNPRGFWEHTAIRTLNEELLERMDSDWRHPPTPEKLQAAQFDDLRLRARELVRGLRRESQLWGWKDPRTTLLLPFWRGILTDELRPVFCLRHPAAVAASLQKRNRMPAALAHFLWQHYAACAVRDLSLESVLVVAYETLVSTPKAEATRIAQALWGDAPADRVSRMAAAVEPELAHNELARQGQGALESASATTYHRLALCAADQLDWMTLTPDFPKADPVFTAMMQDSADLAARLSRIENAYEHRTRELERVVAQMATLDEEARQLRANNGEVESERRAIQEELDTTRAHLDVTRARLARVEKMRELADQQKAQVDRTLGLILQSRGWRLLNRFRSLSHWARRRT